MLLILLIAIFIRPFISSLAFPCLNAIYSSVFLVFLTAYIIYKKLSFLKIKNLIFPFILLFLALFISVVFSQDKFNSLLELYKYIGGVFLFLLAVSLPQKDKTLVIQTIILAGLVISFLAIYQYFFGFKHVSDYLSSHKLLTPFASDYLMRKRVFFPFVTPGILGGYLAMVIPLVLINKNRAFFLLPIFFALLLAKSLGALLSLFFALIIYLCLQGKIKKKNILFLLGLFLLIAAVFISRSDTQKGYLQPVFSTTMRLSYWQQTLGIIKMHPFVGVGLGNLNLQMSRFAHNSYLQIWAEMGLLGLVSFVWIVCAVFRSCFKNLWQPLYRYQITGLFAASAVFLLHNFLDFTFFLPEVASVWWVILGVSYGLKTRMDGDCKIQQNGI